MNKIDNYYVTSGYCYDAGRIRERNELQTDGHKTDAATHKDHVEISEEGQKISEWNQEITDKLEYIQKICQLH